MRALVDTHILLWWILGPGERLRASQLDFLKDPQNELLWSVAVTYEIGALVHKGKVELPLDVGEWSDTWISKLGMRFVGFDQEQAVRTARLEPIHGDPFDRILVAQALAHDAVIVTRDRHIARYPVRVID